MDYQKTAKEIVLNYANKHIDKTDNGDKKEVYLDAYKKFENQKIDVSKI